MRMASGVPWLRGHTTRSELMTLSWKIPGPELASLPREVPGSKVISRSRPNARSEWNSRPELISGSNLMSGRGERPIVVMRAMLRWKILTGAETASGGSGLGPGIAAGNELISGSGELAGAL